MKNSLCDLNDHLFVCLEGLMNDDLSPEELEREMKRAKAVDAVAHTIIDNASVQIEALKLRETLIENGCKESLPRMLLPKGTDKISL